MLYVDLSSFKSTVEVSNYRVWLYQSGIRPSVKLDWDVLYQVLRIRTTTSKRIGIQMAVLRYLAVLAGITS